MRDQVSAPVGFFRLEVFRAGRRVERVEEPNLVVMRGRTNLAAAMSPAAATGSTAAIRSIGYGTNVAASTPYMVGLTGAYIKPVDSWQTQAWPSRLTLSFSLAAGEQVGLSIGEFGLLSGDGTLFARKNRATPLLIDAITSFAGSWTISF